MLGACTTFSSSVHLSVGMWASLFWGFYHFKSYLRSSVHSGLIFDYGVRSRSNFDATQFPSSAEENASPYCAAWDAVEDPVATFTKVIQGSVLPTGLSMCLSLCQTSPF